MLITYTALFVWISEHIRNIKFGLVDKQRVGIRKENCIMPLWRGPIAIFEIVVKR